MCYPVGKIVSFKMLRFFLAHSRYSGVPLVFTEYYLEDLKLNLSKVQSQVDADLVVEIQPSVNPFSSSLPARIPTGFAFREFKRKNVVLSNDFICLIKRKN